MNSHPLSGFGSTPSEKYSWNDLGVYAALAAFGGYVFWTSIKTKREKTKAGKDKSELIKRLIKNMPADVAEALKIRVVSKLLKSNKTIKKSYMKAEKAELDFRNRMAKLGWTQEKENLGKSVISSLSKKVPGGTHEFEVLDIMGWRE